MLGAAVLASWLGLVSAGEAQVYVRAPFVRVAVGDGVAVRAPFVNLWVPGDGPVFYRPFGPRVVYVEPTPVVIVPAQAQVQPMPKADNGPQPIQPAQAPTLDAFSKSFQAKAGSYEVVLLNPKSQQPTTVRFTLPEGSPRRVVVTRDSIEFIYSLRQWVRIEFDRDGVTVTTR
jgi:hypothetical protein